MLILLPPSETKSEVRRGKPFDAAALSFPELAAAREAVLDALVSTSGHPEATRLLGVPRTLDEVVRRNVALRSAATAAAGSVYRGVLYDAFDVASLPPAAARRARAWVVVVSALWGAVRLGDRIPPYRLNMCGRLAGLDHLPRVWRGELGGVLPKAAGRGVVVDCRSAEYAAAWRPTGALAERTVVVKVFRDADGRRGAVSHNAKHTRGLVARRIVTDGLDARRPEELAEGLASHLDVTLLPAPGAGRSRVMQVVEPATPARSTA